MVGASLLQPSELVRRTWQPSSRTCSRTASTSTPRSTKAAIHQPHVGRSSCNARGPSSCIIGNWPRDRRPCRRALGGYVASRLPSEAVFRPKLQPLVGILRTLPPHTFPPLSTELYVCMYSVKNSLGTMGAHPSLDSASEGFDRFAKCEATYDSSGIAHLIWGRWREGG